MICVQIWIENYLGWCIQRTHHKKVLRPEHWRCHHSETVLKSRYHQNAAELCLFWQGRPSVFIFLFDVGHTSAGLGYRSPGNAFMNMLEKSFEMCAPQPIYWKNESKKDTFLHDSYSCRCSYYFETHWEQGQAPSWTDLISHLKSW